LTRQAAKKNGPLAYLSMARNYGVDLGSSLGGYGQGKAAVLMRGHLKALRAKSMRSARKLPTGEPSNLGWYFSSVTIGSPPLNRGSGELPH